MYHQWQGRRTPLWSAVGGLLGPAFMPGLRRDRKPKRARPRPPSQRRFAEPKTTRGSIRPRRPDGSADAMCLGRHLEVRDHQPVLKHGPKRRRGVNAPRLASMNPSSPTQIQLLCHDKPGRALVANDYWEAGSRFRSSFPFTNSRSSWRS